MNRLERKSHDEASHYGESVWAKEVPVEMH